MKQITPISMWDLIASQLNLTIIGDYVPPVVEEVAQTQPNN